MCLFRTSISCAKFFFKSCLSFRNSVLPLQTILFANDTDVNVLRHLSCVKVNRLLKRDKRSIHLFFAIILFPSCKGTRHHTASASNIMQLPFKLFFFLLSSARITPTEERHNGIDFIVRIEEQVLANLSPIVTATLKFLCFKCFFVLFHSDI